MAGIVTLAVSQLIQSSCGEIQVEQMRPTVRREHVHKSRVTRPQHRDEFVLHALFGAFLGQNGLLAAFEVADPVFSQVVREVYYAKMQTGVT
jgi:hypothetical protein